MYTCNCGENYYYITDSFLKSIGELRYKRAYWDKLYRGGYVRYSITDNNYYGWQVGEPCIRCNKPLPERK